MRIRQQTNDARVVDTYKSAPIGTVFEPVRPNGYEGPFLKTYVGAVSLSNPNHTFGRDSGAFSNGIVALDAEVVVHGRLGGVVPHKDATFSDGGKVSFPLPPDVVAFDSVGVKRRFFEKLVDSPAPCVFTYFGQPEQRVVNVTEVKVGVSTGVVYLKGFDLLRGDFRTFRLDRVSNVVRYYEKS